MDRAAADPGQAGRLRNLRQARREREARVENARRALYELKNVQTRISNREFLNVTNGRRVFNDYPIFNRCNDIHFHVYAGDFGAGIRFRFGDGSELKFEIPPPRRDRRANQEPFFGLKPIGNIDTYDEILIMRQNQEPANFMGAENEIYNVIQKVDYNNTEVQRAIRACAELPNPNDSVRGNCFSSFMEFIEDLTGIVAQRIEGGKKGSRNTRKYKKRRVRKSRKKIKSGKSRKNKKSKKSGKSRRRR